MLILLLMVTFANC